MNTAGVLENANQLKALDAAKEPSAGKSGLFTRKPSRKPWILAGSGLVLASAIGVGAWWMATPAAAPAYTATEIQKGNLQKTISATGKVQALTTVQVGTQVSGVVSQIMVDFNDHVKAGQLIARLEPTQIEAQLTQSKSSYLSQQARVQSAIQAVASADAATASAKANVDRADAVVGESKRTAELNENLVKEQVLARRQIDLDKSAVIQAEAGKQQAVAQMNQAAAQAQSARAQAEAAKADAAQAQAAVQVAQVNLDRTYIKAPIDGVVVSRNVDVGQTVAASLSAPVLFLIANDLTKMQVLADIDEADVGQLLAGNAVDFTVDAFPSDTFHGKVAQIRLAPQAVQNVVTYTAVIDVANPDAKLKPGMTASVTVTVADRKDVLLVPNSALRFRPDNAAPATAKTPRPAGEGKAARPAGEARGTVLWKVQGETLQPVRVKLGLSDGVSTEVVSGGLQAGDRVATPALAAGQSAPKQAARNPMFGGATKGGKR
ncbi:MAG: efflux RND transporter periplasmic adaptor subunit [Bryobacteraceae bacterium]